MTRKIKNPIYVVRITGDNKDSLDWFEVFGSRTDANEAGRQAAKDHEQQWNTSEWKFVYLSYERVCQGKSYLDYQGERTIVVEQLYSIYHGA
jgi:hypothetical protein